MTTYKMQGYSMVPTIRRNQILQVDELAYRLHGPERGDIILPWVSPSEVFDHRWQTAKRVIGLPGDAVEIRNGEILINGTGLPEPYVEYCAGCSLPKLHVPEGHYFVLGDNRVASADSNIWGTVPGSNIVGKILLRQQGAG